MGKRQKERKRTRGRGKDGVREIHASWQEGQTRKEDKEVRG